MAVNDTLNVRPLLVNFQVQQGFAGSLLDARCLFARHIHRANVFSFEKPLAVHGRRAKNFVFADADRDVAVVGGGESFVVKASANFANVLLDLVCVHRS